MLLRGGRMGRQGAWVCLHRLRPGGFYRGLWSEHLGFEFRGFFPYLRIFAIAEAHRGAVWPFRRRGG